MPPSDWSKEAEVALDAFLKFLPDEESSRVRVFVSSLWLAVDAPERRSFKKQPASSSLTAIAGLPQEFLDKSKIRPQARNQLKEPKRHQRPEEASTAQLEQDLGVLHDDSDQIAKPTLDERYKALEDLLLTARETTGLSDAPIAEVALSLRRTIFSSIYLLEELRAAENLPEELRNKIRRALDAMGIGPEPITQEELDAIPKYPGRGTDSLQWYEEHWAPLVRAGRVWQHDLEVDPNFYNTLRRRFADAGTPIWQIVPPKPGRTDRARRRARKKHKS